MQTIIGVRFKKAGKIFYFGPGNLEIKQGDRVIVETVRGVECGEAVLGPREVPDEEITPPLSIVHRIATEADLQRVETNKKREKDAFGICERKIREHGLPMKLIDVEFTFDNNKIIFYFTADGRIDFRELVKDLAAIFRTRIELRQIGVRDEAKLLGGIGCCGRPLCCASFLGDFEPVSIRMAKEQNLSLNPTKISGICGRLMCCLKYESGCYCGDECPHQKERVQAPEQGSRVISADGEGKVINVNLQRHTATVLLDNRQTIVTSWDELAVKEEEDDVKVEREIRDEEDRAADTIIAELDPSESKPGERRPRTPNHRPRPRRDNGNRRPRTGERRPRREGGRPERREGNGDSRFRERRPRGSRPDRRENGDTKFREHRPRPRRDNGNRRPDTGDQPKS